MAIKFAHKLFGMAATVAVAAIALQVSAQDAAAPAMQAAAPEAAAAPMPSKGEYLARAANCVACHSVDGGEAFSGG